MVRHTCDPSIRKVEAGGSGVQGHPYFTVNLKLALVKSRVGKMDQVVKTLVTKPDI